MGRSERELQAMADMITLETYGQMPRDRAGDVVLTPIPDSWAAETTFDGNGMPVEPVAEVPPDFDLNIHLHADGGIYRRYAAGIRSILDRANLVVFWTVERVQARHYADEDLEVRFEAGDLVDPNDGHDNAIEHRLATVVGVVAWHRTGGDNLTDRPLYVEEQAIIRVISRTAEDETTFRVRPAELAQIKARVRDVILRDHLLAVTREENAWRMEPWRP